MHCSSSQCNTGRRRSRVVPAVVPAKAESLTARKKPSSAGQPTASATGQPPTGPRGSPHDALAACSRGDGNCVHVVPLGGLFSRSGYQCARNMAKLVYAGMSARSPAPAAKEYSAWPWGNAIDDDDDHACHEGHDHRLHRAGGSVLRPARALCHPHPRPSRGRREFVSSPTPLASGTRMKSPARPARTRRCEHLSDELPRGFRPPPCGRP